MEAARRLTELRAEHVLILAAMDGVVGRVECAMPECVCPQGRTYFERRGNPLRGPWAPSADRWPVPGREGGEYVVGNVRLAHWLCNAKEGWRHAGRRPGYTATESQRNGWQKQDRAVRVRNGSSIPMEARVRGGAAGGRKSGPVAASTWLPAWRASAAGKEAMARNAAVNGPKGRCQRWQINRGKACVCGLHFTQEAAQV